MALDDDPNEFVSAEADESHGVIVEVVVGEEMAVTVEPAGKLAPNGFARFNGDAVFGAVGRRRPRRLPESASRRRTGVASPVTSFVSAGGVPVGLVIETLVPTAKAVESITLICVAPFKAGSFSEENVFGASVGASVGTASGKAGTCCSRHVTLFWACV